MNSEKVVSIILAVFIPPLAVFMRYGCEKELWINLVLCCFVWFPAILHAVYLMLKD